MGKKICVLKKNKLYVYEIKTNLKFYKIKDELLKNNCKHINGIYNFNLDEIDYYENNEEVKMNGHYVFIQEKNILKIGNVVKMFYKGFQYPEILDYALLLRDGETSNINKLNEFKAPVYIKQMKDSRKKRNLLKDYPYDAYVDAIISCFSLKKTNCINYSNMEDLVKKIADITKYNSSIDPGDKEMFNLAKKAEVSMFIPDDYGDETSGIYKLKKMLREHAMVYNVLESLNQ